MARAIENKSINIEAILQSFQFYLNNEGKKITRAEFEKNLILKINSNAFKQDILPLLPADTNHDFDKDFDLVMDKIITKLPEKAWQGLLIQV